MEFLQQRGVGLFRWVQPPSQTSQELNSTSDKGNTLGSIPGSSETGPKLSCLLTEGPPLPLLT